MKKVAGSAPDAVRLSARQERFEALVARHRGIIFKIAHAYSRDPEDRRDLAQEIVAQVWRAFPTFDATRRFSTWMYRIALNVAISHRRSSTQRARYVSPLDVEALAALEDPASTEPDVRLRELQRAIAQLDDFHRALIVLYLEGHDYREIADVLGITETNVATRLSRLRQRLREQLVDDSHRQEDRRGTR